MGFHHKTRKVLSKQWYETADFLSAKIVGIKSKGRISKGCFKKTKHAKFSDKQIFLSFWYLRERIRGVRHVCFLENLASFVFLKHPFWDSHFWLVTDKTWSLITTLNQCNWKMQCLGVIQKKVLSGGSTKKCDQD